MKIAKYIPHLIVSTLLATALPAVADAGAFQFVSGEVKIVRPDGRESVAVKGVKFEEGDTVVTGASGRAQLVMADEAMIALRPDSTLRFDTYRFAGREDGTEKGILGLIKGGFRTLTGLIGRANKSNYLVRTPTATIGIRGTDHEAFHIPPGGWSGAPGADPGTYDRVNAGATYLQTEGGRIELAVNQVGFVPPTQLAAPRHLDRMPDFMRPPALPRGPGEQRGMGEGQGRRGPPAPAGASQTPPLPSGEQAPTPSSGQLPPPSDGQMPAIQIGQLPPPPDGQMLATQAGQLLPPPPPPPLFEPTATDGSLGFNQAVSNLTPAPLGFAGVGGDRSNGSFFGSGGGRVDPADPSHMDIFFDSNGQLALVADQSGFQYVRNGAPLVHASSASFMDGSTQVGVKWGVYAGGSIVDNMGPRTSDYFHFMAAPGTPATIAATLSGNFTTMVGHTPAITELGVSASPTVFNAANTYITLSGGNVTNYNIGIANDGFGRSWLGSFSGSVPVGQFVEIGVPLSGSGPGGALTDSHGHGLPVGPTGQGIISSYDMKTPTSGITGSFIIKQ